MREPNAHASSLGQLAKETSKAGSLAFTYVARRPPTYSALRDANVQTGNGTGAICDGHESTCAQLTAAGANRAACVDNRRPTSPQSMRAASPIEADFYTPAHRGSPNILAYLQPSHPIGSIGERCSDASARTLVLCLPPASSDTHRSLTQGCDTMQDSRFASCRGSIAALGDQGELHHGNAHCRRLDSRSQFDTRSQSI